MTKHGLILDFLSSFSGQVDFLHMEPEHAANYTEGAEVKLTLQMDPFGVYNIESVIIYALIYVFD